MIRTPALFRHVDASARPLERQLLAYLASILYALSAVAFTLALGSAMDRNVFLLLYVAVLAAALAHGPGPGIAAVITTALSAAWWFMEPFGRLAIASPVERVRLAVFVAFALLIVGLSEWLRRARAGAEARERELRESERRYRAVLEGAGDAILVSDADGRYLEVNERAVALTGFDRATLLTMNVQDLITPDSLARTPLRLSELAPGKRLQFEREFRRADGGVVPVEVNGTMLGDGRILVIARDLTGRRRLEEQLRHSQKMEAIGRLAGGLAHDLNNILTVVATYSELLLTTDQATWEREDVKEISKAAERAAELTRKLLTFSRKQLLRADLLDVDSVISESERMLRAVVGPEVALELVITSMPWRACLDRGQLEQVIVNLAVNSRDAMPDGGRLRIATGRRLVEDSSDDIPRGEYVTLTVTDTGVGMDAQTLAHLFEPFFTTKPAGRGTGLGLATVYGIVSQADGHIRVRSAPGDGTTFTILFPRARRTATSPVEGPSAEPGAEPPATILVVDDEPAVLAVTERILSARGHRVLTAPGGAEALEQSQRWVGRIDLLLTDLRMPGMNGRELADRFQADRPDAAVLFMSGFSDDELVQAEVREARVGLVPKPFTSPELAGAVHRALRRARAGSLRISGTHPVTDLPGPPQPAGAH